MLEQYCLILVIHMKFLKYMAGSLIISFGILLVMIILLRSLQLEAPDGVGLYLGITWIVLAVLTYPLAKKIMRV